MTTERELSLRTADLTIMLGRHPMELALIAAATAKVEELRHQLDGEAVAVSAEMAAMAKLLTGIRKATAQLLEVVHQDRARLDALSELVLLGTSHGPELAEGERLRAVVAAGRGAKGNHPQTRRHPPKVGDDERKGNQARCGDRLKVKPIGADATHCGCQRCTDARSKPGEIPGPTSPEWRYACEVCGNKRCPHHEWHGFRCTGSNATGQVGEVTERWGCHAGLFPPGSEPDGCVIDEGRPGDCGYTRRIERKEQCRYWRRVTPESVADARGDWEAPE